DPNWPLLVGGEAIALRTGDAQLDAIERASDALRILAGTVDGQRPGLRAVVAGEQPHPEPLLERLGDARRQRRAGAEEPRVAVLERLDRRDAGQRSEQRRRPREEIDSLLAQQLGDSLGRDLVFEEE